MVRFHYSTVGLNYAALRKECLQAVRQWPGCKSITGIQIIRNNRPGRFSVRITLYGKANVKTAEWSNGLRSARETTAVSSDRLTWHSPGPLIVPQLTFRRLVDGRPVVFSRLLFGSRIAVADGSFAAPRSAHTPTPHPQGALASVLVSLGRSLWITQAGQPGP